LASVPAGGAAGAGAAPAAAAGGAAAEAAPAEEKEEEPAEESDEDVFSAVRSDILTSRWVSDCLIKQRKICLESVRPVVSRSRRICHP